MTRSRDSPFQSRPRSPDVKVSGTNISIKFMVHEGTDFKWLLSRLLVLLGDQGSTAAVHEGRADLQVKRLTHAILLWNLYAN